MKITFLCGSLEPGLDGVGDYTRRLASDLIRRGLQVKIVALNDSHICETFVGKQQADGTEVDVLRLPSLIDEKIRFASATAFTSKFTPDYISLQFVPFSFNTKGVLKGFSKKMIALKALSNCKWHIMFHELWVGVYGETSFKHRILGQFQKIYINKLIRKLKPDLVTTSINIYVESIRHADIKILPLFGNIAISNIESRQQQKQSEKVLTVLHFGTFTSAIVDFEAQIKHLTKVAEASAKTIEFIVIGNGGHFKAQAINRARELLSTADVIRELGYMSFEEVSQYMLLADVGISRADYKTFGKSGSTISMFEHGIPVILRGRRPDERVDGLYQHSLLMFAGDAIKPLGKKQKLGSYLTMVGDLFLKYIK